MTSIEAIKPGLKRKNDDSSHDKRQRVTQELKPKYPPLKKYKHEPGD